MKKLFLTAASTILAVGVLAACGDQDLDDPTMTDEPDYGTETEGDMGGFDEEPAMDEGTEDFGGFEDESDDLESDLDMGEEEDTFEFETEEDDAMEDEA
ncbi:MAG: hypothetical protein LPK26_06980 [Bacillaceae bacterium]|nr:hypothetical protein [Bacillaceae bacterium]